MIVDACSGYSLSLSKRYSIARLARLLFMSERGVLIRTVVPVRVLTLPEFCDETSERVGEVDDDRLLLLEARVYAVEPMR